MRIAINGMGRIGRLLFRRLVGEKDITLVAINDIMDSANLAYLLKYDSLYGTWPEEIRYEEGSVHTCGQEVKVFRQADPLLLDWAGMKVDIVLECSGRFSDLSGAQKHIKAGAKRVLLSTTGSSDIPLLIFGHNHKEDSRAQPIISPGGCMTNCSTHILYLLNSIGIESVHMNILHSYTSRQELVDTAHTQFRRGRAAAESIIPVEIDLAHSLERLLPLKDKIAAVSVRVPVTNGAMADITVQMKEEVTKTQINYLLRRAAEGEYKGIIQYTEDPLVSADIKGNTHSCIMDGSLTSVIGKQVKIIAWFDNEYGFTSRMIDWVRYLSSNNQHQ